MKPRHAAALALVGWYLMVPPLGESEYTKGGVDFGAPLSTGSFRKASIPPKNVSTPGKRNSLRPHARNTKFPCLSCRRARDYQFVIEDMFNSCIASNDPRLKVPEIIAPVAKTSNLK